MTEFTHRNQPVTSVVSAVERVTAAKPVAPVAQSVSRTDVHEGSVIPATAQSGDEPARDYADYAKVNRDIASAVENLDARPPATNGITVDQAESAILSLLPQPSVVLPLPPATEDMVAFVAGVAQSIQRQAAQTRAALSGIAPTTVDAAIAA